ncbi:type IV pilin protein [Dyella choica]|uniref:Prepilin-type N-terminal cleavage/methylation domain-containing protein n=1 Tax=Dyella choica TaxID=1927959 RepID=A0A432M473_9GAMM|nr:type IV pilin protein [Dyella choica]RUL74040.1 prepilin-type N-terminal cleavage/methylation domain-containing protein [Dyella choica]
MQKWPREFASSPSRPPRRQRGFTLIELMIVVAIAAILAAIALPQFRKQVQKSNRTSAKSALLDLARREETFYSTNNAYATKLTTLGYTGITSNTIQVPNNTNEAYYNVTITQPASGGTTASAYTATATPTGAQSDDSCGTYSIDYLGSQQATGTANSATGCW